MENCTRGAQYVAPPSGADRNPALELAPVFSFMGRFFGFWACLCWSVCACGAMAVHRLGLTK